MRIKLVLLGTAIAALAVFVGACGGDDDGDGDAAAESYDFAIVRVLDDPFFNSVLLGAQEKAEELEGDVSVELIGPDEVDPAEQIAEFDSLVARGVDGIGVAPVDAEAIIPAIRNAQEADIPVVAYNLEVADPSVVISSVLTDTLESGRQAGRYMCELLGEDAEGTTFISQTDAGNPTLDARWAGYEEGLAEDCPDVESIGEIIGCEPAQAESMVQSAIVRNPDLIGFYMDTQCTAIPTVSALGRAQLDEEPAVVAYDATPAQLEMLRDGEVDALIAQKGLEQGELTIEYLYQYVNGGEVPEETITDTVLMTQDNLDDTEQWAYPAGGGQ